MNIILDTETTGLRADAGDRIIEIAAIKLDNNSLPTDAIFHCLIHPSREILAQVSRIHGITLERLREAPRFGDIVDELLAFLGNGCLIAHNAPFDIGFLNAELKRLYRPALDVHVVDTLALARELYPKQKNNLEALCARFGINVVGRETHNAVLDCHLLSQVYVNLIEARRVRDQEARHPLHTDDYFMRTLGIPGPENGSLHSILAEEYILNKWGITNEIPIYRFPTGYHRGQRKIKPEAGEQNAHESFLNRMISKSEDWTQEDEGMAA
jgi:DNA polymerase-3 subunit epsilon